ncbi:MAG TPA: REP-associated tyrosine transposase [Candidatus Avalokitesvara rifleensis]|uniref:REP-associated tyrosine transposase n=1 Tax=Candidatus Avalokitesvara rifleensis TaxID=3367620 RepID=UPI004028AF47
MTLYPKRKQIRLESKLYRGPVSVSLTMCFCNGIDVVKGKLADAIAEKLLYLQDRYKAIIYAYCILPDHMHILLGLQDDKHNVLGFVKHFKRTVSIALKGQCPQKQLWQDRFYDHILRRDEDVDRHARYILENPLRKGLVKDFLEYKYIGGSYLQSLKENQRT